LDRYSAADLEREYGTAKACSPFCTINCVHQTALLDELREHPRESIVQLLSPAGSEGNAAELPASVRILTWMFLSSRNHGMFSKAALRILGLK
jgi:hypothetical protein